MSDRPTLEAALAAWATTEPAGAGDQAALDRILAHAQAIATPAAASARLSAGRFRPNPGWMLGGALAASLAIALLLASGPGAGPAATGLVMTGTDEAMGGSTGPAEAGSDTRAAFALLYTPTVEEEYQL